MSKDKSQDSEECFYFWMSDLRHLGKTGYAKERCSTVFQNENSMSGTESNKPENLGKKVLYFEKKDHSH